MGDIDIEIGAERGGNDIYPFTFTFSFHLHTIPYRVRWAAGTAARGIALSSHDQIACSTYCTIPYCICIVIPTESTLISDLSYDHDTVPTITMFAFCYFLRSNPYCLLLFCFFCFFLLI